MKQNISLWASLIAIVIAITVLVGVNHIDAQLSTDTAVLQELTGQAAALGSAQPNNIPHGFMNTGYGYYIGGTNALAIPVIDQYGNAFVGDVTTKSVNATTSATTYTSSAETLQQSDFASSSVILFSPATLSTTLTFPASSTMTSFLPVIGQSQTFYFADSTTTAANKSITLAAGTGDDFTVASSTAGNPVIWPQKFESVEMIRSAALNGNPGDFYILVTPGI